MDALLASIPQLVEAGVTLFISLIENLPTIILEIVKAVPQIIAGIVTAFTESIPKIVEVGANLVRGLWEGIQSLASWLWDKVSGWISSIWDGICDFFGIHSPSKEMGWIGEMLVEGLAGSLDKNGKTAVRSAEHLADGIFSVMQDMTADMRTAIPSHINMDTTLSGLSDVGRTFSGQAFNVTIPLILVMTPERLLYLLISKPEFKIDYIFIDEAHKMTGRNSRGPFYYKTVDMLAQQKPMPHFIFASPNIPNPEVYLKLVTEAQKGEENAISSTFAPVTQFKFLISQETKSIRIFNDHTQDTIFVCKYGNATMSVVDFMNIMTAFDRNRPLNERKRNIAYFSGKNGAIEAARAFAEGKDDIDDDDLKQLANDIRDQVHGDYYLTKLR